MQPWYNLTQVEGAKAYLALSSSEYDWQSRTRDIFYANKTTPAFWHRDIINSGFASTVAKSWPDKKHPPKITPSN